MIINLDTCLKRLSSNMFDPYRILISKMDSKRAKEEGSLGSFAFWLWQVPKGSMFSQPPRIHSIIVFTLSIIHKWNWKIKKMNKLPFQDRWTSWLIWALIWFRWTDSQKLNGPIQGLRYWVSWCMSRHQNFLQIVVETLKISKFTYE